MALTLNECAVGFKLLEGIRSEYDDLPVRHYVRSITRYLHKGLTSNLTNKHVGNWKIAVTNNQNPSWFIIELVPDFIFIAEHYSNSL